jgi:hypothetical protein
MYSFNKSFASSSMNMKDDKKVSREEKLEKDCIDEKNWMNENVNSWINDDWIILDRMRNDCWIYEWIDSCDDRIVCKIDCVIDAWTSYCNVWRNIEF